MRRYVKVLYISLGLGLVVAAFMLFVAFDHNSQGEFIEMDTGKVNIQNSLEIFISWFLVSSIVVGIISLVITFLAGILMKIIKGN